MNFTRKVCYVPAVDMTKNCLCGFPNITHDDFFNDGIRLSDVSYFVVLQEVTMRTILKTKFHGPDQKLMNKRHNTLHLYLEVTRTNGEIVRMWCEKTHVEYILGQGVKSEKFWNSFDWEKHEDFHKAIRQMERPVKYWNVPEQIYFPKDGSIIPDLVVNRMTTSDFRFATDLLFPDPILPPVETK